MKFKIPLLLTLLMPLLTQISFAQTLTELQENSVSGYGIEPEKYYPGNVVLELMHAAEAEIEAAVNEAFAEGYKASMLQYAPDLAALRIKESVLKSELSREKKKNCFFLPMAGVSFTAGVLITFFLLR